MLKDHSPDLMRNRNSQDQIRL